MKKITFLTLSLVLLLALNAVTLFLLFRMNGGNNDHGSHPDGNGPADYIIKALKLDGRQQEQFAAMRDQHRRIVRDAEREDHRLHDLYFGLLKSDAPDRDRVDSIAALIGEQRTKLAAATFDHFSQLRAICRDDQKKLFDATIEEIARMVAGHPPGDGPPPPPERER